MSNVVSKVISKTRELLSVAFLNTELIKKLDLKDPNVWLATWGGCGLSKYAPGTVGTLGGLPLGLLLLFIGGWPWLFMGFIIVIVIGYRATVKFEAMTGEHDSGAIVIDEVAGILLTLMTATPNIVSFVAAFFLFRLFDVLKPWPVSWADKKLKGALGVMADDILAALYAAACLWGLNYAGLI